MQEEFNLFPSGQALEALCAWSDHLKSLGMTYGNVAARGMTLCDPAFQSNLRIMPIDSKRYPQNWIKIANSIKDAAERALSALSTVMSASSRETVIPHPLRVDESNSLSPSRQFHARRKSARKFNCPLYTLSFSPARSNQTLECLTRATVTMVSRCGF
jgi:hypothetical protein